jgi:hypothetical protein
MHRSDNSLGNSLTVILFRGLSKKMKTRLAPIYLGGEELNATFGPTGRLGWVPVIRLPQSSACQRSLVEVRPTIPVCTLV